MAETCERCGAEMERARLGSMGSEVRGWRCPKCGHELLTAEDSREAVADLRAENAARSFLR